MVEEIKPEEPKVEKKEEVKPEEVKDFKIAEIWIRSGQIMLDAAPNFWADRCRALGVLEFCKDIVKTAKMPEPEKNKVVPVKGNFLNELKGYFSKHRRN